MQGYRKEIDGLRAIAVTIVVLSHAGFRSFRGGFIGVDVFFVISGYLIARIIAVESFNDTFSYKDFFERRARRIFPALYFMLFVCTPTAWWLLDPAQFEAFSTSAVSAGLFLSNFYFAMKSGYFDVSAELSPLLHTWSLSVEWQFYLLFPSVFLACHFDRAKGRRIFAALLLCSLAIAQYSVSKWPVLNFFMLPSRIWELMIGAGAYLFFDKDFTAYQNRKLMEAITFSGLFLISLATVLFSPITPIPGTLSLVPTIGAALVLIGGSHTEICKKLLTNRVLRFLGLASYSIYLWHYPIFSLARNASFASEPSQFIPLIILSCMIGFFSWSIVEAPFRQRHVFSRKTVSWVFSAGALAVSSLGVASFVSHGFESSYLETHYSREKANLIGLILQHTRGRLDEAMVDDGDCRFWTPNPDEAFEKRFVGCSKRKGRAIVVLGDSHAMNMFNIFSKADIGPFIVGVSQGGCRPHDDHDYCHYAAFEKFLDRNQSMIGTVVFHQSGSYLILDEAGLPDSQKTFEPDAPLIFAWDKIEALHSFLERLSAKTRVVWLGPFIEGRVKLSNPAAFSEIPTIPMESINKFTMLDRNLKEFIEKKHTSFHYHSLVDLLKMSPDFMQVGTCITFRDVDHFSSCGEAIVAEKLKSDRETGGFRFEN